MRQSQFVFGGRNLKLNFRPNKVAFLDFETQSEYGLKKGTARGYARHSSTKALTCVVKVADKVLKLGPYLSDEDKSTLQQIAENYTLVAHNAPFDAAIWENTLKLPEATWFDTLPCARAAGLPGSLDQLSLALGGRGKHKDGKRLIEMLCIIKNGRVPAVGPAHQLLMNYNVQDVEELETIYTRVKDFGEPDVMVTDRIVNDRGIPIDRAKLTTIIELLTDNALLANQSFAEHTDNVNPRSSVQVCAWLEQQGYKLTAVNKNSIKEFLAAPDKYLIDAETDGPLAVVKEMLELRAASVGVGSSKANAMLQALEEDDRARDQLVYWGAHTGRWSGRRMQPHNMQGNVGHGIDVKNATLTRDGIAALVKESTELHGSRVYPSQVLGSAVKTCVTAKNLCVADYGTIEVRILHWMCDDTDTLNILADQSRSVYVDFGKTLFGRTINKKDQYDDYQLCKSIVLGCGYGMSGAKFELTLATRDIPTEPLKKAGLTPADCVKLYRKKYPAVVRLWNEFGEAGKRCLQDGSASAGKCQLRMVDRDMHMILPSGRHIVYRNARLEMLIPAYCKFYNLPEIPVPTVVYDNPREHGFLYGSKLCENADQGIARDIMAAAINECDKAKLPVVVHVHDEIVVEAEDDGLEELCNLMVVPPEWAKGIPILVEGYSGACWTKQPKGYRELIVAKDNR